MISPTITNDTVTSTKITLEVKQIGAKRGPNKLEMMVPATPLTLRQFISFVVQQEIADFKERQEERKIFRFLSSEQIAEGAATGKIDSGGRPDTLTEVDSEKALRTAIQAFEDQLYYVFVDDTQQEDLDGITPLCEGSRVMFLRLVALAGG